MKQRLSEMALTAILMAIPGMAYAQFNTIRRVNSEGFEILTKGKEVQIDTNIQLVDSIAENFGSIVLINDTVVGHDADKGKNFGLRKKHLGFGWQNLTTHRKDDSYPITDYAALPNLTITNLLEEIRKNGIQHEKIVLAQAILETGWFTSSVCRNKNNLFGLTNPRTGQYYEFRHWTESVRAYYDKVQYRYKGGNYLLWLKNIGYAEDPRYVSSLIRILRQYMM